MTRLPCRRAIRPGLELDGLEVEEVLHDSRVTMLTVSVIDGAASAWC